MKREHFEEIKKIEGLVFCAPLEQDYTKDIVSGQELVPQRGTVTWDDDNGAYKFEGPTSKSMSYYIGSWNNLDMDLDISNAGFTFLYEVNAPTYTICPIIFGGRQWAHNLESGSFRPSYNQWNKYAITLECYSGTTRYSRYYYNGVLKNTLDRGNTPTVFSELAKQRVEIDTNNTSHIWWMRNAMIFNRPLTQDEIIEIQNIE